MTLTHIRLALAAAIAPGFLVAACAGSPTQPADQPASTDIVNANWTSQTVTMTLGQELDVTLQTVGPGSYDSIPDISAPVIRFEGVAYVSPYVPAGPTQRFRFVAQARGQTIITLGQIGRDGVLPSNTISDTVVVR